MAVTTVPNAASTYTTCAIIPNSNDRWVVLGLAATTGCAACAIFMYGLTLATASMLMPIIVPTSTTFQSQIFNSPCNSIIVASVAGGSAIIWVRSGSHA